MEQDTTTQAPPVAPHEELTRPTEGRILAGVAAGLAKRFNVPVLLIRALFVLLTFGGGLGIALYAAGWFLIRSDDETETPAERTFSGVSSGRSWIGIGLVFLAILILLDNFTFLSGGVVWAIGLLIVGILLYTGDLPRLSKQADSKEGVQQMTTDVTAMVEDRPTSPPGGGTVPPAPTPPILPPPSRKPKEKSILGRLTIGVALVGLGIMALLDNIPGVPVYAEPRHYVALAVAILGLGLIVGGFVGRARWLILVGAILIPSLLFSPVFELDLHSDSFDRTVRVTSFEDLEGGYSIDVGNLVIDLTDLPFNGESIELSASVDAGNLEVILPDNIAITGTAGVDVGRVSAPGRESSGLGSPTLDFNRQGPDGSIDLDLHVDVGNIDVRILDMATAN